MPIIVHSPHSGRPVKIRDQDIGRAVKDEEGRIFYAVLRSDGQGHYGARTRHGSPKEEQRYLEMLEKGAIARQSGIEQSREQLAEALHDATGHRRRRPIVVLLLILLLLILAAAAGYYVVVNEDGGSLPLPGEADPSQPSVLPPPPAESLQREEEAPADGISQVDPLPTEALRWVEHPAGLQYRITRAGAGEPAQNGDYVQLAYRPARANGLIHPHSPRREPAPFVLGVGLSPLPGLDQSVAGMRPGEVRVCRLPGALARSQRPVHLELELMRVQPGIRLETRSPGEGDPVTPGKQVALHFEAFLAPDSHAEAWNLDRSQPLQNTRAQGDPLVVKLGAGRIIPGLEAGVIGMRPGEKRLVTIPPHLAYGARGAASGLIPPDATLAYQVELVGIVQ